ncbi:MAG: epoxyqueuosine reductase [Chloroflexota bacterium]
MSTARRFQTKGEAAQFISNDIKAFVSTSPANHMAASPGHPIFDEPLVQFADAEDPIFTEFKSIINPAHLTPQEALAQALGKRPSEVPARLSVISWILPISATIRESNRARKLTPSRLWSHSRWYGEKFGDALRSHVVAVLTGMGYSAAAPMSQPYFHIEYKNIDERGYYSNWSERHMAYAAGLGTFSLSDGLITELGVAHRCGSVVTDLGLPASPRTARTPHSNCLFYVNHKCNVCVSRCPGDAISEQGHDKARCHQYIGTRLHRLLQKYEVGTVGCGLCQTKVPCESHNPAKNLTGRCDPGTGASCWKPPPTPRT